MSDPLTAASLADSLMRSESAYRLSVMRDGIETLAGLAGALVLALWVHELGHAGVARLLGYGVRMIRIGTGPILVRLQLGRAWLVVRPWPGSGAVSVLPRKTETVASRIVFLLGGLAANAAVLVPIIAWSIVQGGAPSWLADIGAGQGIVIAINALPLRLGPRGARQPTDGLRVWRWIRRADPDALRAGQAVLLRGILADGAPLPPVSPDTPEATYQVFRPDRLTETWARRDASEILQRLLVEDRLAPSERAAVLVALVTDDLRSTGADAASGHLDAWSAEAVALAETPATLVARAGALVALGRAAEAETLLAPLEAAADAAGLRLLYRTYRARAAAAPTADA